MTIETKIAGNANEAIELVKEFHARRPDCRFEYDITNHSNDHRTEYRHFDAFGKDGNGICFGLIEVVVDGKLAFVRVINTFRETAIDIMIGNDRYEKDEDVNGYKLVETAEDNTADDTAFDEPETEPPAIATEHAAVNFYQLQVDFIKAQEELSAAEEQLAEAQERFDIAQETFRNTIFAAKEFGQDLTRKLINPAIFADAKLTLIHQQGCKCERQDLTDNTRIYICVEDSRLCIRAGLYRAGYYDTPEQVATVINRLKDAINRGDSEFIFPTVDELDKEIEELEFGINLGKVSANRLETEIAESTSLDTDHEEQCLARMQENIKRDEVKLVELKAQLPPEPADLQDSLERAIEQTLEKYREFCAAKDVAGALNEANLYAICMKGLRELWRGGECDD